MKFRSKLFLPVLMLGMLLTSCGKDTGKTNDDTGTTPQPGGDTVVRIDTQYAYEEPENPTVFIHYYNYAENYKDWLTWIWPDGGNGARFYFQKLDTIDNRYWATLAIDTSQTLTNAYTSWDNVTTTGNVAFSSAVKKLGVIIRNKYGTKEYDGDRFVDLTQKGEDGKTHLYVIEGSPNMFYDVKDVDFNMISSASLINLKKIEVKTFSKFNCTKDDIKLYCDGQRLEIDSISFKQSNRVCTINLKEEFDLNKLGTSTYLEIDDFGHRDVEYDALYNSSDFNDRYYYDGQLGAIYTTSNTTFKLWAPTASAVKLKLYNAGNGTDKPYATYDMVRGEKGVFSYQVNGDLDKKYYTYDVTIGDNTNEDVCDPYAVSTGVNGLRGEVLNMAALNPTGWEDVKQPNISSQGDAIVYELHTHDLTSDDTWNGTEANRGKFLGLCEEGTTYTDASGTYATGFDHIKEMGVTHVQLQPIFDFKSVDETKLDDETYKNTQYGGAYNWGYDPQNYNSLEGSYSSNPYEGSVRVAEFKEVCKAYNNAGIGIIMDVVFNHMPGTSNASFEKIFPGYYFRNRNDSGAGADTACERAMFQKYMEDVTEFWIKEYKLAGYRFDLMGLHTVKVMKSISQKVNTAVKEINPNALAIIYGEAWDMYGGDSVGNMAIQNNVNNIDGVGCFNDVLRDAVRGSNSMGGDDTEPGWAAGSTSIKSYNLCSGLHKNYNTDYVGSAVNYCECHDNLTFFDKLQYSMPNATEEALISMDILGASLVFSAQGIAFMQAGQEFLKTKEVSYDDASEKIVKSNVSHKAFNRDSYNAWDEINSLKWDRMVQYKDVVDAYKNLIAMRKEQKLFTPSALADVTFTSSFVTADLDLLKTSITKKVATDDGSWNECVILSNNTASAKQFEISDGYSIGMNNYVYTKVGSAAGTNITIPARSFVVLYK